MTGRNKVLNKEENSSNNIPEVASPKTIGAVGEKKSSNSQEISKPSSGSQASPNLMKNVAEMEGGNEDNGTDVSNTHKTKIHSVIKVDDDANEKKNIQENEKKNIQKNEKKNIQGNENSPSPSQTERGSKKKRRKRRKKSKLDTSGPFECVEPEVHNSSSLNRASVKYKNWEAVYENKALLYKEEIFQRISEIEFKSTETAVKKAPVVKKSCYPETVIREAILSSKEEKKRYFSDDDKYVLGEVLNTDNILVQPVIFMKDKATQTDSVPVTAGTSKLIDAESSTSKKSYLDDLVITKPTESDINFEATQTDSVQETAGTSKSIDVKSNTSKKSFSDCSTTTKPIKPDLNFKAEITKHVKNLEDVSTLENKIDLDPILSPSEIKSTCTPNITDPATDPTAISKPSDNEEITLKPDLDELFLTKQPEPNSDKTTEEMQPKTYSELADTLHKKRDNLLSSTSSRTSKRPRLDPELQSISKSTDIKNSDIFKSFSDGAIVTKSNKLTLHFPDFEIKTDNVSMDIATFHANSDSPSNIVLQSNISSKTFDFNKLKTLNISDSTAGKNGTILKSESEGPVINVPTKLNLTFADEGNTPENLSSQNFNFQSKTESFPNSISSEVSLQSINIPITSTETELKNISKPNDGKK